MGLFGSKNKGEAPPPSGGNTRTPAAPKTYLYDGPTTSSKTTGGGVDGNSTTGGSSSNGVNGTGVVK